MADPIDSQSLRRDLPSLADRELDPVTAERLQLHLANDAQAAQTLQQLQQLTSAARRAIRNQTPPPSQALRDRLHQIMNTEAYSCAPPVSSASQATGFWMTALRQTLAASLLLAVGVWIGRQWARPNLPVPSGSAIPVSILPASDISTAEEIHGFCSRLAEGLHEAGYPTDLARLATSVESDLQSDHPYPDLSRIGYRYRGAGPCGKSLPDTVHLLYRSMRPGSIKAVSIFVQGWHNQYPLDPGRLYTVSVPSSPFPMLAWRTDKVVYFLLANDLVTVQKTVELLHQTPTSRP